MGRNILVVEDDKNISDLIHMYLVKEGFDVRIAGDGGKALEEFQKKEPDLILLDIMLPVMDGWAVCAKIRETSKVPIIMLTAKSEVFDRIQGLEMGADDYIVKPFEMKELIARINAVLRRTEIPNDTSKKLHFDKLTIDLDSCEPDRGWQKIDTPPRSWNCCTIWRLHPQPGLHPQPAFGRGVGLRLFWRQPHRGRAYQAPARKGRGRQRPVGAENRLGRGL